MKRYSTIIISIVFTIILGCKKESTDNISTTEKVSFPQIKLKGPSSDSIIFIQKGGNYAEAGATLIDDITNAQSDISPESSDINIDSTGVYTVSYRAHNKFGFETTRTRLVVIYNPADSALDYSGTYAHNNGRIVTLVKAAPRLFKCDDLYGTFSIPIPGYFVDCGDFLYIPIQPIDASLGNEIHGIGERSGTTGSYILDFYGLIRDGNARPRKLTEQ